MSDLMEHAVGLRIVGGVSSLVPVVFEMESLHVEESSAETNVDNDDHDDDDDDDGLSTGDTDVQEHRPATPQAHGVQRKSLIEMFLAAVEPQTPKRLSVDETLALAAARDETATEADETHRQYIDVEAPPATTPSAQHTTFVGKLLGVETEVEMRESFFEDGFDLYTYTANVNSAKDSSSGEGSATATHTSPAGKKVVINGPSRTIVNSKDSVHMHKKAQQEYALQKKKEAAAKKKAEKAKATKAPKDSLAAAVAAMEQEQLGTSWDTWMWAVVVVLGGQMYGWNSGFAAGFGSYFTAQVVVGIAYACLMCCIAENTAALAFPGGSYGLARVVLGFYAGTMIGFLEVTEYLFMISTSVFYIGQTAVDALGCDPAYQVAFWFALYAFVILTTCGRKSVMFATNIALFVATLGVILIYCLGSLKYTDLRQYGPYLNNTAVWMPVNGTSAPSGFDVDFTTARVAPRYGGAAGNVTLALGVPVVPTHPDASYWFIGGPAAWMTTLTTCTAAYAGVEALPLLSKLLRNPRRSVPVGATAGVATLFTANVATTVISASLPPGLFTTAGLALYMNAGFALMFPTLSALGAYALIIPGQVAMAWGFIVPTGNLLQSLAASNILPRPMLMHGSEGHRRGVVVCCVLSLVINLVAYHSDAFGAALQNIAVACGVFTYMANFVAFYKLRTTYKHIERGFKSPLGFAGAAYGAVVMVLVLISVLFFQSDNSTTLICLAALLVLFTLYYYAAVAGAQIFSPDESTALLRLHVSNMNASKQRGGQLAGCGLAAAWARVDAASKRFSKDVDSAADALYRGVYARVYAAATAHLLPAKAAPLTKAPAMATQGNAVHPEG